METWWGPQRVVATHASTHFKSDVAHIPAGLDAMNEILKLIWFCGVHFSSCALRECGIVIEVAQQLISLNFTPHGL